LDQDSQSEAHGMLLVLLPKRSNERLGACLWAGGITVVLPVVTGWHATLRCAKTNHPSSWHG